MAQNPAFQFYPGDFLSDENQMVMSLPQAGAYIRLMCVCWKERSIPNDLEKLAKLVGTTATQMAKLWPGIEPCFEPRPRTPDRLLHPRLEIERRKQAAYKKRMSEAGKKGSRAKSTKKRYRQKPAPDNDKSSLAEAQLEPSLSQASARASQALQSSVFSLQSSEEDLLRPPSIPPPHHGTNGNGAQRDGLSAVQGGTATARHRAALVIRNVLHLGQDEVVVGDYRETVDSAMKRFDRWVKQGHDPDETADELALVRIVENFGTSEPITTALYFGKHRHETRELCRHERIRRMPPAPLPHLPAVDVSPPLGVIENVDEKKRIAQRQIAALQSAAKVEV